MNKGIVFMAGMVLFLFTSIIPASAATQNLMPNGGFESDGSGWNLFLNNTSVEATATYPTTGAKEGSKYCSIKVSKIASNASDNWFIQMQNPAWTAVKGAEYHLSFWAKADAPHTIQVAIAGDSVSKYTYRGGTEVTIGTTWKQYEVYRTSDVAGSDAMRFNFYCGYATGTYDFDNVVLTQYSSTLPTTMAPSAQSAWESGKHRNLFVEMGIPQTDVDAKVNAAFQQLFFGDHNTEAVYTTVGTDMGFINQPGGGSIITEGQSYGMIIAVMMDKKEVFDRLWRFAKTYMQHKTGDRKGYFSWQINEAAPYSMQDPNPAPDGEEYFVTSLLIAAKRWGNGSGVLNYQEQADSILAEMRHKVTNASVMPMIDSTHAMIVFSPVVGWNPTITDASYHLPAFYKLWSLFATQDKEYWAKMTDSSRAFFKRACHPTTGLMSDLQNWDGTPYVSSSFAQSKYYKSDAWRTAANIGCDYAWFKADPWQVEQSVRLLKFFNSQGDYKQRYAIDGTKVVEDDGTSYYSASGGQIACNAVSALACNDPIGWKFVEAFWKMTTPSGTWRYYSGLLHMMGLLHCSGKFIIYGNPSVNVEPHYPNVKNMASVNSPLIGSMIIVDINGRIVASCANVKSLGLTTTINGFTSKSSKIKLTAGVYFVKFTNGKELSSKKLIVGK